MYRWLRAVFRVLARFRGLYVAGEHKQRARIIENPEIRAIASRA